MKQHDNNTHDVLQTTTHDDFIDASLQTIYIEDAYVVFQYREKKQKYKIIQKDNAQYIEIHSKNSVSNEDNLVQYRLVQDEAYILNLLKQKDIHINLDFHIFFIAFDLSKKYINYSISASHSIFVEELDCTATQFKKYFGNNYYANALDFSHATFLKKVSFWQAEIDRVNFESAYFFDTAEFMNCIFNRGRFQRAHFSKSDFRAAQFKENANFISCTFHDEANFEYCSFEKQAVFSYCNFINDSEVSFATARIQNLQIDHINKTTSYHFILNLRSAAIESVSYIGSDLAYSKNRETFTVLKDIAIKRNNQIEALYFYKQEMECYYKRIMKGKPKGKWYDRVILSFERYTSNYGTNPVKPFFMLLCINFIFSFLVLFLLQLPMIDNMYYFFLSFIPSRAVSYFLTIPIQTSGFILGISEFFKIFQNLFSAILVYEILKSMRKFSRRL